MVDVSEYTLSQRTDPDVERRRLAAIHGYQDPPTFRRLDALGVAPGWHCLDVGAGGGSIAAWLGRRVGATGRVLATDLEIDALRAAAGAGVEVVRHDVRSEPLPAAAFDLVHARLLLTHLPERDAVLARLVEAARPGGWVLIGDIDFDTVAPATAAPALERVLAAFDAAVRGAGWDPELGPKLPAMLDAAGLRSVEAESFRTLDRGGGPVPTILTMTYRRLLPLMLAGGTVTAQDVEDAIAWLADPANALFGPTIWAAWGRRS